MREIDFDQLLVRIFACSYLILTEHRTLNYLKTSSKNLGAAGLVFREIEHCKKIAQIAPSLLREMGLFHFLMSVLFIDRRASRVLLASFMQLR